MAGNLMTRILLLRDGSGQWHGANGTARPTPEEPLQPVIEAVDLDPAGLREALRAPGVLLHAPVMPTRLVEPEPLDSLRAGDAVPGWGLQATGVGATGLTGAGVTVALLDTGIETGHPAFDGMILRTRDFAGTGVEDANGHGTHLAGTVFGRDIGPIRIGVARGVTRAIIAKALTDQGRGTTEGFVNALVWSAAEGAEIIAFALALDCTAAIEELTQQDFPDSLACAQSRHAERMTLAMTAFILRMFAANARFGGSPVVLAAVGNDSRRMIAPEMETGPVAPAAATGVIPVAAFGPDEGDGFRLLPVCNTGAVLAAPGGGIVSAALDGGLRALNGSSMAVAHAAGIAALWSEHLRKAGKTGAEALIAAMLAACKRDGLAADVAPLDCVAGMVCAPRASGLS